MSNAGVTLAVAFPEYTLCSDNADYDGSAIFTAWRMVAHQDILYDELASGKKANDLPRLRNKDVCRRATLALNINTESREGLAVDSERW